MRKKNAHLPPPPFWGSLLDSLAGNGWWARSLFFLFVSRAREVWRLSTETRIKLQGTIPKAIKDLLKLEAGYEGDVALTTEFG